MGDLFLSMLTWAGERSWLILWSGAVLLGFELLLPASRCSMVSRLRAGLFWLVYIAISAAAMTVLTKLWASLGVNAVITLRPAELLSPNVEILKFAGLVVAAVAGGIFGDFFYYWFHRLQHAVPALWHFHRVHHSIREVNAFNSYHHPIEEILRFPFITVPTSLLIGMDAGPTPFIVATILNMHGLFIHSCTRFNLGILRYIVADNRFHRIHHSLVETHMHRNFGAFSSIWDILFGTGASSQARGMARDRPARARRATDARGLFSFARREPPSPHHARA
jgi:sterol desaturase/sphingolipid hydroxylase (fatty acid hydroxylase superfamily)